MTWTWPGHILSCSDLWTQCHSQCFLSVVIGMVSGGQKFTYFMFFKECAHTRLISHVSPSCLRLDALTRSLPLSFLIPMLCLCVCSCVVFVGVRSAWAVGGVVVMESVLRDLWPRLQNTNQEVCEWRRCLGMRAARDSDQTLQHSRVPWLVASPYTVHDAPASLARNLQILLRLLSSLKWVNTYSKCTGVLFVHCCCCTHQVSPSISEAVLMVCES